MKILLESSWTEGKKLAHRSNWEVERIKREASVPPEWSSCFENDYQSLDQPTGSNISMLLTLCSFRSLKRNPYSRIIPHVSVLRPAQVLSRLPHPSLAHYLVSFSALNFSRNTQEHLTDYAHIALLVWILPLECKPPIGSHFCLLSSIINLHCWNRI